MTSRAGRSGTTGTQAIARTAAIGGSSVLGVGAGLARPLLVVVTVTVGLLVVLVVLILTVSLPEERSDRLYRWGRLILGREEPADPTGS